MSDRPRQPGGGNRPCRWQIRSEEMPALSCYRLGLPEGSPTPPAPLCSWHRSQSKLPCRGQTSSPASTNEQTILLARPKTASAYLTFAERRLALFPFQFAAARQFRWSITSRPLPFRINLDFHTLNQAASRDVRPLIVSIPHRLGREEAKRRLRAGLTRAAASIPILQVDEEMWEGDRLVFRVRALGQAASGHLDVAEDHARLEITLPWLLQRFAKAAQVAIRKRGNLLLTKQRSIRSWLICRTVNSLIRRALIGCASWLSTPLTIGPATLRGSSPIRH